MLAKKCDRCGKLYEHYGSYNMSNYNSIKLMYKGMAGNEHAISDAMDLCPKCMEEFKNFMKIKIEGD